MNKKTAITTWIKVAILLIVPIALAVLNLDFLGLAGITATQQGMLAIFVFAALSWIFEIYPAWVTSIIVIALITLTDSDSAFAVFRNLELANQDAGVVVKSTKILKCFGDPSIILYIGGLVMAITATKIGLDAKLARAILHPFGKKPANVLLGVMVATGLLSMFMSDTATTALMIGMMTPVFAAMDGDTKGKASLALSITFAALIGGMGTPVGTPPAMLAFNAINSASGLNFQLSFAMWMAIMVPFCILLIFMAWRVLIWLFPFSTKEIEVNFASKVTNRRDLIIVVATYAVTILLWITGGITGVQNSVAALVPVVILSMFGIFTAEDLNKLPWAVLWMFAGGLALGIGMDDVGLSTLLIEKIPFASMSPLLILVVSALICWGLSNFISNTGTAALIIPILTALSLEMGDYLAPLGGGVTILVGIAISASMAMTLPVSTPGNAIAYSTTFVTQKQMAKAGLIIGLIGLVIAYAAIYLASLLLI